MNDKEMMERYIYEVTRRVPQNAREEIRLELQSLIEDMCEQEDATMEQVLQKLGRPTEFAKQYKDGPDCLIGPEYYANYIWVLKIALIGVGISAVVSACVQGIMHVQNWQQFFFAFFGTLFSNTINSVCSVIGIVTVIFAIFEWKKVKISVKPEEEWKIDQTGNGKNYGKSWNPGLLPPVPDKRSMISRGDSIISIVFIILFATLLLFEPELFSAFHYDGKELKSIACIFNLEEWNRIVPFFVFWLFVGLLDEIVRLVNGCYCKVVMYSNIICNSILIVGAVILLKILPLWNVDFAEQIKKAEGINQFSTGDILHYWGSGMFSNIILMVICMISFIEVGVTVYKTLKYA